MGKKLSEIIEETRGRDMKPCEQSDLNSLWQEYKETDNKYARDKLVHNYLPLVKQVVARVAISLPLHIEKEELSSFGVIGLFDAIEKFDYKRGYKFETYAYTRIRGSVLDGLRDMDWVPNSIRKKAKNFQSKLNELEQKIGRSATEAEIASFLDISESELNKLLQETAPVTFIPLEPINDYDNKKSSGISLENVVDEENNSPEKLVEYAHLQNVLGEAIEKLPEKEKMVVALYYFEDLNLKEISSILKLSESRISQLHSKAIFRLRGRLGRIKNTLV